MSNLIPYTQHTVSPDDEAAVLRALHSHHLTQGPEVEAFEQELAALSGAKYAVCVNSGTAALHLAYRAHGTEWIMPAISFVASANATLFSCIPEELSQDDIPFKDCNQDTGLVWDWSGTFAVTLGGQVPVGDFDVMDACHGPIKHLGTVATILSFHPAKHVACGEGGAILTNDDTFADQCRLLRSHGRRGTEMVVLGYNYRMPEINAALGRSQLTRYHENVRERRRLAHWYDEAFAGKVRTVPHSTESARHLYQIIVEDRDAKQKALRSRGIGTAIHYPVIPLQPYYRERYGYRDGQFPGAEWHAAHTLSIPLFPTMTEEEQDRVISAVLEVCG